MASCAKAAALSYWAIMLSIETLPIWEHVLCLALLPKVGSSHCLLRRDFVRVIPEVPKCGSLLGCLRRMVYSGWSTVASND